MAEDKPKFFQFRKKKDVKGLAKAKAEGGSYTVKSNKKLASPKGGVLKRGAKVSYSKGSAPATKVVSGGKGTISTPVTKTTKTTFLNQDYNEREAGKGKRGPQTRKTTSEFTKQYRENPEKVKAREAAQAAGQETYRFKGKHELSGKKVKETESKVGFKYKAPSPKIVTTPGKKAAVKVVQPKDGSKGGFERKLPRVSWLKNKEGKKMGSEGKRKKTESGHGR